MLPCLKRVHSKYMPHSRFTDPSYFASGRWQEWLFIISVCLGELMANTATTMAMTQMYTLQKDFHAAPPMLPWYSASFGQAMGSVTLISGQIGDVYGIKAMIMLGYAWTVAWSIVCGVSYYDRHYGPQLLICARTFQGCGVAFVLPNILGAAGRIYADGSLLKRLTFGSMGFCVPFGLFLGAWFSGIIDTETKRWDWGYYAYAIFSFVSMLITYICVPSLPPKIKPNGDPQKVDWLGGVLVLGGLNLFAYAWNQAPVTTWQNPSIYVLLIIGVALLVAFLLWEIYFASDPIFPPYLLKNKDPRLTLIMAVTFLGWGAFGVTLFRTMMIDQQFRHYTPFATGSTFATMVPMGAIAAVSCAFITNDKTVEYVLLFAMLCYLGGALIIATTPIDQKFWRNQFGAWIIEPFGMGWSYPAATIMMSDKLPPEWQGLAGSFISFASGYGIAIFLGIAGVVQGQLTIIHPDDLFHAIRGALYFGIGISGLASAIAFGFLVVRWTSGYTNIPVCGQLYKNDTHDERGDAESNSNNSNDTNTEKADGAAARRRSADNDSISELSVVGPWGSSTTGASTREAAKDSEALDTSTAVAAPESPELPELPEEPKPAVLA